MGGVVNVEPRPPLQVAQAHSGISAHLFQADVELEIGHLLVVLDGKPLLRSSCLQPVVGQAHLVKALMISRSYSSRARSRATSLSSQTRSTSG